MQSSAFRVQVSVDDFGPIASGKIELRPLTIFVGPSNAGKTYLAVLIYSLHKAISGLSKYAIFNNEYISLDHLLIRYFLEQMENTTRKPKGPLQRELEEIASKLEDLDRPFTFEDLPKEVQRSALSFFEDRDYLADDLKRELERCFDVESLSELVRVGAKRERLQIGITAGELETPLWSFKFSFSEKSLSIAGSIENMSLDEPDKREPELGTQIRSFMHSLLEEKPPPRMYRMFAGLAKESGEEAYYFPAARSGIMQSHRVIASSLMGRATRAGLEKLPELPTFSGVLVDFMQRLILYSERGLRWRVQSRRKRSKIVARLAEIMEEETLEGRIRLTRPAAAGYPEFRYHPGNSKKGIGLSRASSMVTELAPIVQLLKSGIVAGDTLIVEEPEAHLHPAAQTELARLLGRLVNCGVRVIVTTHSDWLLKAIGNLMREGALLEEAKDDYDLEDDEYLKATVHPQNVGIWLFRKPTIRAGSTIEEIPFDTVGGIEPEDYDLVDEQLYNRAAELQNKLAERDSRRKR